MRIRALALLGIVAGVCLVLLTLQMRGRASGASDVLALVTTPVQTVLERSPISLPVENRAKCPADCRDAEAGAAVAAIVRQSIDLARDIPIRVRLLRFADDDHALVVVVHHIAFDGWSAAIFSRECCESGRAMSLSSQGAIKARLIASRPASKTA